MDKQSAGVGNDRTLCVCSAVHREVAVEHGVGPGGDGGEADPECAPYARPTRASWTAFSLLNLGQI